MENVSVRRIENVKLEEILLENGYLLQKEGDVYTVELKDASSSKAIMILEEQILFVQLDIIGTNFVNESMDFYKKLLDLNTEILPVSLALDTTDPDNERIVINESLDITNLDENELLNVFEAIELSLKRVFNLIKEYIK